MADEFKVPPRRTPALGRSMTPTYTPRRSMGGSALTAATNVPEALNIGDQVSALQYSGILRFLGQIGDKPGVFGGIELTGQGRGYGKNDGSVLGIQYFECEPDCGIFVPASKITPTFAAPSIALNASTLNSSVIGPASFLPRAPSTTPRKPPGPKTSAEAAKAAEARIQPGSRASKYINMTASQLHSRPGTVNPRKELASSTATIKAPSPSKTPTPRAKSRQSFGIIPPTTPATAPKRALAASVGPSGPRSIRRPASRNASAPLGLYPEAAVPEVPPVPSSYAGSQASGRRTPSISGRSTPSALPTPGRRYSQIDARPNTPARSVSRQSQSSEIEIRPISSRRQSNVTRPSSRASLADSSTFDTHSHTVEVLQAEKAAAQRSADEARLAQNDAERALKLANARFEELRLRLESTEQNLRLANTSIMRGVKDGDEASRQGAASGERVRELETILARQQQEYKSRLQEVEAALQAERQSKHAALQKAQSDGEKSAGLVSKETADLQNQVAQLKQGGAELCRVYDEELEKAAQESLRLQNLLKDAQFQLDSFRDAPSNNAVAEPQPDSSTPSALAIDNETLKAEADHLRNRVLQLEEQLQESQSVLEQDAAKAAQRRLESAETETNLRKEIKALKDDLSLASKSESRTNQRIAELEKALSEARATLEKERAELEGLRAEQPASSQSEDLLRLQAQVTAYETTMQDMRGQNACLSEEVKLLEELRADLESESAELRAKLTAQRPESVPTDTDRPLSIPRSPALSLNGTFDETRVRDENVGLKHIVNQLNTEMDDYRVENKQLLQEVDALKEAQRSLEQTVTTLMEAEDRDEQPSPSLRRSKNSLGLPLAADLELQSLRVKYSEVERRKNKEIAALQQEIAELETLIEVKIFKEDALDSQLSLYRDILRQAQSEGFKSAGIPASASASPTANKTTPTNSDNACELCGATTHAITECPIMNGSLDSPSAKSTEANEFCETCETKGHTADACPSANDVF